MAGVAPKDLLGPYTLYLEGVRTRYAQMIVTGVAGGFATASVALPFDHRQLIMKIRGRTACHIGFGNGLFLLFEGELVDKRYEKTPKGPTAVFVFNGVMGNIASAKYAMLNPESGGLQAKSANMATGLDIYSASGESVGAIPGNSTFTSPEEQAFAHLASGLTRDIADRFVNGLKATGEGAGFDMAAAFREILHAFIYAAKSPDKGAGIGIQANGVNASVYLATLDYRYKLIDSLVGATSQELIKLFYGVPAKDSQTNEFVASILNESVSGEYSLLEVLRLIAYRAFHGITEMVAPPMLQGPDAAASAATSSSVSKNVLGRMMMVPRLFHADPPVCNVFLPQMTTRIAHNVTPLKTTRLITSQMLPAKQVSPVSFISVSPSSLEKKMFENKARKFVDSSAITAEEMEVGVLAQGQQNVYGSAFIFLNEDNLGPWFQKTNPLRFYIARSEGQPAEVAMEFNPFVAVGFPGLFYDPDLQVGRGLVNRVTHVMTPRGATTTVGMTNCFFGADACEAKMLEIDAETGFDGNITQFRNRDVSEIYQLTLGCESLVSKVQGASGGGTGFKIDQSAKSIYDSIAAANSNFAEKDAVANFITRNIARFSDLAKMYSTSGKAIPEFTTPPFRLPFETVFMDAKQNIQIGIDDANQKASVAQKLVVGPDEAPGDFQVVDRVQAVLDYVKEIEG